MKKQIKRFIKILSLVFIASSTPFIAFAATQPDEGLSGILLTISNLFSEAVPVLVGLGVVYFIWGVVQYFIADNEEAKTTGKDRIIYGIIGLAIIISLWGLVNILTETFFSSVTNAPTVDNLAPATGTSSGSGSCPTLVQGSKLQDFISYIICFINDSIIPLIFSLAVVMFIWGAVQFFVIGAGEEEKRAKGKQFMIWGIISLAVMLSVWSLVNILTVTFGFGTASVLPQVIP